METVTFKKSDDFKEKAEKLFEGQKEKLTHNLLFADIQHVGGTSVSGLLTKGDLDLNVRVSAERFDETVECLKSMYKINQPENWTDTYASFKDDDSYALPLGIQVTVIDSSEDYFVKHRQALLSDPDLIERFNEVKVKFEGKNMGDYRNAKSRFLEDNGLISDKQ